jgi:hypothetical protein
MIKVGQMIFLKRGERTSTGTVAPSSGLNRDGGNHPGDKKREKSLPSGGREEQKKSEYPINRMKEWVLAPGLPFLSHNIPESLHPLLCRVFPCRIPGNDISSPADSFLLTSRCSP